MRQSLVLYDDRGPAKSLPKRGSLYASRPETVGANVLRWALMNVLIFLLPFVTNLLVLLAAQSHLRTHGIVCVTYAYFYFSFTSVCALLAIATGLFPRFFRYHLTLTLLLERRRHRSHFSFMSQRRINALCGTGGFTVFIIGLASCSLPLFVTDDTTVGEIYEHLVWLGLVPKRSCQQLYFALRGRRVDWSDTMQCLGLGTLSHLELRITIPGGASNAGPSQASSSRPQRNKDTSLMTELLAEEHLDEFGKPRKNRPADGSRIRKRKRKQKTVVNTDSEDGDFTGSDSGSDSDSEIEEVISNEEVADSLPSKTVNKGKARATNPAPKKRVKKSAPSAPSASAEASSSSSGAAAGPSSATPPAGPSKQSQSGAGKQKNPIYLFFEPVTSDSDGSQAEGARYFKCFLGNREIVSITKSANHNTSKLQKHLEATSKAHFRLFHVLWKRSEPPTAFEISLAKGVERMTDALTKEYQQKSDKISGNIKEMLQKQVDDAKAPWDKAHFERLVASWVAACDQPFIAVNKPEFRAMIRYAALHPPEKIIKIPKDQSVKDEILRMEKEMVEELSAIFKENTSDFALSLDAWTSSNGFAFMAIVIHYIGNDGKLEECLIDFQELLGAHSGHNMAEAVWKTVEKFGLQGRIIAFVMDNATNNDTLVEAFEKKCQALHIPFESRHARMRCMPHTIHLAALKLLEAIGVLTKDETKKAEGNSRESAYQDSAMESLSPEADNLATLAGDSPETVSTNPSSAVGRAVFKLRKIVRHVRSSPQRRAAWKKEVRDAISEVGINDSVLMLILDVKTRWSSTHQMLRRAKQFRLPIFNYVAKDSDLRQHEISDVEWTALKLVTEWLMYFRSATTQMSATKQPVLSTTHAMFRGLEQQLKDTLKKLPPSTDPALKKGLIEAHTKLSDYYAKFDESRYYLWAALLDPGISYERLKADYGDDESLLDDLETVKADLEVHYDIFYSPSSESNATSTSSPTLNEPTPAAGGSPVKIDFLARYKKNKGIKAATNELAEYFRITGLSEPDDDEGPLEWWYRRRNRFPNLYRLVRNVLCIPGSAVAVERIFSGGRDTIGLRRASLKAETIQTLMFVKARLRVARKALEKLEAEQMISM